MRRVAFGAVLELDVDVLLFDAHGWILGWLFEQNAVVWAGRDRVPELVLLT